MLFGCILAIGCSLARVEAGSCVWKVTGPDGPTSGTLYLGGSWHALRSRDYPLPSAFNIAFDASSSLAFEISPKDLQNSGKAVERAGTYSRGDNLKNHVDPRTYDYLRRFFGLLKVPESKFNRYRPWYLSLALDSPDLRGMSEQLGVESYLERRAQANSKPMSGLETLNEHVQVFSGLSERGSEALLLLTFIPADKNSPDFSKMLNAWRSGDADFLTRTTRAGFSDYPAMADRLLTTRNRNWIPKIEGLHGIWALGWDPWFRLPLIVACAVLAAGLAIWPAHKNLGTLLSCSAAVMVAVQFWHGFGDGGGMYMAWYLPLLLMTVFRPNLEDRVALTVLGEGWFLRRRARLAQLGRAALWATWAGRLIGQLGGPHDAPPGPV